jgi:signal transduction histidine kinase
MMRNHRRQVLLVTSDAELARQLERELPRSGFALSGAAATTLPQARARLRKSIPDAILLDESALGRRSWPAAVRELVPLARVVCLAGAECRAEVEGIEDAFAPDVSVVWREGAFLSHIVSALGEGMERAYPEGFDVRSVPEDFGEILRHEMNNPLTGILGNAELLLARREGLPPTAVQRLQTIADLAVRLRETIRRLSNAWESEHPPQVRSA